MLRVLRAVTCRGILDIHAMYVRTPKNVGASRTHGGHCTNASCLSASPVTPFRVVICPRRKLNTLLACGDAALARATDDPHTMGACRTVCHLLGSGNQLHPTGLRQTALTLSHHTTMGACRTRKGHCKNAHTGVPLRPPEPCLRIRQPAHLEGGQADARSITVQPGVLTTPKARQPPSRERVRT